MAFDKYILATDMGLVGDGVTDNSGAIEGIWNEIQEAGEFGKLVIPPGEYHSSTPNRFMALSENDDGYYRPHAVEAWGAVFDHAVVFGDSSICPEGMQVRKSPTHGFVYLRGQGSYFNRLQAEECEGFGHFYGSTGFSENSQVTASVFNLLTAQSNKLGGYGVDGSSGVNRSWLNNNVFQMPVARNNRGPGWSSNLGESPVSTSRMNYNLFAGLQCEGNADHSEMANMGQRANTLSGCFISDTSANSAEYKESDQLLSLDLAPLNYVSGGRYVGDITNKDQSSIHANTKTPGEGGRFSYEPFKDD